MGLSSDVGLGRFTGEEAQRGAPCTGPSAGLSKLIWTGCYRIAGVFWTLSFYTQPVLEKEGICPKDSKQIRIVLSS